ncbi:MAG: hypothetical protein PVI75_08775 [Gammaproteobacteria bacterium]|jgi:hypothetical protein
MSNSESNSIFLKRFKKKVSGESKTQDKKIKIAFAKRDNCIDNDVMQVVVKILQDYGSSKNIYFDFSNQIISDDAMKLLFGVVELVKCSQGLQFSFRNSFFSDKHMLLLGKILKSGKCPQDFKIDISNNVIKQETIEEFCSILKYNLPEMPLGLVIVSDYLSISDIIKNFDDYLHVSISERALKFMAMICENKDYKGQEILQYYESGIPGLAKDVLTLIFSFMCPMPKKQNKAKIKVRSEFHMEVIKRIIAKTILAQESRYDSAKKVSKTILRKSKKARGNTKEPMLVKILSENTKKIEKNYANKRKYTKEHMSKYIYNILKGKKLSDKNKLSKEEYWKIQRASGSFRNMLKDANLSRDDVVLLIKRYRGATRKFNWFGMLFSADPISHLCCEYLKDDNNFPQKQNSLRI